MRPFPALRLALFASVLMSCASSVQAQRLSLSLGGCREQPSLRVSFGRAPSCAPARVWVEGRWETRVERVWVEGCERRVWSPARFETRWDSCGRRVQVLVSAGHWTVVRDPGRYEQREVRVWVPGYWRESAPRY